MTKVEVKKVSGDSNSGKGFFDNPENRKRVKVAAAVVAGVAAIVVGGQAIKKVSFQVLLLFHHCFACLRLSVHIPNLCFLCNS